MMAAASARLAQVGRIAGLGVVAVLLLALLSSTFRIPWLPLWVPLALAALALLAAVRPSEALLVVAALTPVAQYSGSRWNGAVSWPETLVVSFAAGWTAHRLAHPSRAAAPPALGRPAFLFAAVTLAAVLVELAVVQMRLDATGLARALWEHLTGDYFITSPAFRALHTGALLLEGLVLFLAAADAATSIPGFRRRAAVMLALGAATAAVINVLRLAEVTMRADEPTRALWHLMMTQRINVHHADPNAAGSHFAMSIFVAAALATGAARTRVAWTAMTALLTFGLWITGSRAALLCAVVAAAMLPLVRYGISSRRSAAVWLTVLTLLAGGFFAIAYAPMRGNQRGISDALETRTGLAMTSIRMLRENPVFGIGLGEFHERSGEFSSPELLQLFPAAIHENAHNNYLQIMAEQGLLGLTAFLWMVAAVLVLAIRQAKAPDADRLALGLVGGAIAFLLTCIAGHPLLIPAAAYAFWILFGVAGGGAAAVPDVGSAMLRRVAAIAAVLVFVSILPRANAQRNDADLEHVGIGVSGWHRSEDGVRYRWAEGNATVFVPGRVAGFLMRLRTHGAPVDVELGLDGRPGNVVRVEADRWNEVRTFLPRASRAPRFRRLDIRIVSGGDQRGRLMIGRVEPFQ